MTDEEENRWNAAMQSSGTATHDVRFRGQALKDGCEETGIVKEDAEGTETEKEGDETEDEEEETTLRDRFTGAERPVGDEMGLRIEKRLCGEDPKEIVDGVKERQAVEDEPYGIDNVEMAGIAHGLLEHNHDFGVKST